MSKKQTKNQLTTDFTQQDLPTFVDKFYDKFWEIPFENSEFQNLNFVINSENTPGRAYRHIGLRMSSKLSALQEAYFGRKKEELENRKIEIEIKKLQKQLEETKDEFEQETLKCDIELKQIELEQKASGKKYSDKLIRDAITELDTLNQALKQLPEFNKESFEKEEEQHFVLKLEEDLRGIKGAMKSLQDMGYGISGDKLTKIDKPQLVNLDKVGKSKKLKG